ncbi:MAG: c-type cytochrome [Comamonas sp.]
MAASPASQAPAAPKTEASLATTSAATPVAAVARAFAPPAADAIPDGPMGDVIRKGEQIFLHTGANAKAFVGNALNCVNCHLDAGRQANSAPLWGAYTQYPAYRSKTKSVDTFSERLRGCFMYSMNGKAPPDGHETLVALEAYAYWMSKGAPVGEKLPGASYPKVPKPAQAPDYARGQKVFTTQCALCHGDDGQGQRSGDVQVFPPLWGKQSYNWGAGMHEVDKATGFIKANMPLGLGNTLSDQDAWDVATYINSHERPQDPRFTGSVADTRKQFHDTEFSLYGQMVNGKQLGQGFK